jgi:hypothetical protein
MFEISPLPAGECNVLPRSTTEWTVPLVRILSEAQVPLLPWDALLHHDTISNFLDTLLKFTDCCLATSTVIQALAAEDSALRPLSVRIIRQYASHLLDPALKHLAASQDTIDQNQLSKFREKLQEVHTLFGHGHSEPRWVAATVFSPAFDASYCLVGEALPRWNRFELLREWEQALCDMRFPQLVRSLFADAHSILQDSKCVPETPVTGRAQQIKLIEDGKKALKGSSVYQAFTEICTSACCFTLRPKTLRPVNQCSTCQCFFPMVKLTMSNSGPHNSLGDRWDLGRPWQCAEADLVAQLIAVKEPSLLEGKQ